MASKALAFLTLCCLLLVTKQVAAGRGRILDVPESPEPDYDAWLNGNLADAKINKTTRKLMADNNNDQALYNDLLNNPTKYAELKNDTPKFAELNEEVLFNEILKNPAKFNAILNDTAPNNDPAKIIELNETAVSNEVLQNPIKYTNYNLNYGTVLNDTATKNIGDEGKYNTLMGSWFDALREWMQRTTPDQPPSTTLY